MSKETNWSVESKNTINDVKRILGSLAEKVRTEQYLILKQLLKPNIKSRVIDVGVSSEEDIKGTNLFEKKYEYPKNLTLATIENAGKLRKLYTKSKTVKIYSGKKLPFKDQSFDIAVSWATLEHVGGYRQQQDFINELLRIGKKIFITTPYRGALYEPHSGFFLLHWLPLHIFRTVCRISNKKFWSVEKNLNPLWLSDIRKMKFNRKIKIKIYKTFKLFPSHIIITT